VPSTQRALRLPVIVSIAIAALLVLGSVPAFADAVANSVARQVNALRVKRGLRPLAVDGRLIHAARWQSGSMLARQSLSHGRPDGKVRLTNLCREMHASTVGETIGWIRYRGARAQAAGIVRWWMNSPPHRAALMSSTFNRIGVGRKVGHFGGHKVVWFTADMSG
jgi:uncharacterized protein YkwD